MITHDWHTVKPGLRMGQSPDDIVTLYRGFAPDQLSPEGGMLSSDAQAGNHDAIARIVRAINEGDIEYFVEQTSIHTHNGYAEARGLTTPFVSVTSRRQTAEFYSGGPGEKLATLRIKAARLIVAHWWQGEILVLGGIDPTEIVEIEDGVPRPEPAPPAIDTTPPILGLGSLLVTPKLRAFDPDRP